MGVIKKKSRYLRLMKGGGGGGAECMILWLFGVTTFYAS